MVAMTVTIHIWEGVITQTWEFHLRSDDGWGRERTVITTFWNMDWRTEVLDPLIIGYTNGILYFEVHTARYLEAIRLRARAARHAVGHGVEIGWHAAHYRPKAFKYIHFAYWCSVVRNCLKHWIGECRQNLMDFREEERKESVIPITKDR